MQKTCKLVLKRTLAPAKFFHLPYPCIALMALGVLSNALSVIFGLIKVKNQINRRFAGKASLSWFGYRHTKGIQSGRLSGKLIKKARYCYGNGPFLFKKTEKNLLWCCPKPFDESKKTSCGFEKSLLRHGKSRQKDWEKTEGETIHPIT